MKTKILIFFLILYSILSSSQILLPIHFESNQITTDDFINFDGGTGSVIENPYINDQNLSGYVGQIIRNGGQIWAGSYLVLVDYLDFSSNTHISMNVYSPISGLTVKFKLEGDNGAQTEGDTNTTVSNGWETLTWSFAGEPSNTYNKLVLMFDFGNIGDGSVNSTFYLDDITSFDPSGGLSQIDLPVTFEDSSVYYSLIDFEGNGPSTIIEEGGNHYVQVIKTDASGTSAGVTIGTEEGFATNIPITNSDTKMYAHVYVDGTSQIGIPVRLKIENSNDPTQSVETEAFTTVAGNWEILEFDFNNEASGTAVLNTSFPFNMASMFFNFGSSGNNDIVYFFDNISFSSPISLGLEDQVIFDYKIYPNPTSNVINIQGDISDLKVIIYDVLGKVLMQGEAQERIDISFLNKGTYFISLTNNSINSTHKIIKN
ncbi:MAG: T9SS type A sorting domain-containing protein [Flavobacteriaceae bacterium]